MEVLRFTAFLVYQKNMRNLTICCFIFLLGVISCAGRQVASSDSKFEWLPTECAPINYPARILRSYFVFPDGSTIYIPGDQLIQNGWGKSGSVHIIGEKLKPVPSQLIIQWFSYLENRFYSGRFDLPVDRIHELFRLGVPSPGETSKRVEYKKIAVGVAPGGDVSLWMIAERTRTEVASFRAPEKELPWKWVLDNPDITRIQYVADALKEALAPEVLLEIKKQQLPLGRWQEDTQRWNWDPMVKGPFRSVEFWVSSFNGENEWVDLKAENLKPGDEFQLFEPKVSVRARALPSELTLYTVKHSGASFKSVISFDRDEARRSITSFATVSNLQAPHSGQPIVLKVEANVKKGDLLGAFRVILEKDGNRRELTRVKSQSFQLSSSTTPCC
jgi:hypothetical protein